MERQNKMRVVLSNSKQAGAVGWGSVQRNAFTPSRPQEPIDTWPLYVSFYHLEF